MLNIVIDYNLDLWLVTGRLVDHILCDLWLVDWWMQWKIIQTKQVTIMLEKDMMQYKIANSSKIRDQVLRVAVITHNRCYPMPRKCMR